MRRLSAAPGVKGVEPNRIARLHTVPNDPFLSEQWGLHNFGQVVGGFQAGVKDVDSDLPEAWRLTTGSSDVLVAVVDSGISPSHPDLAPIIAPGGWDFVDDDNDPSDPALDLQHGSLVASIIGARGNDNYGVTGAAQRAAILPLRVAGPAGTLTAADAAEAYAYAASHGARIVNSSFGGFGISQVELAAIRRRVHTDLVGRRTEQRGALVRRGDTEQFQAQRRPRCLHGRRHAGHRHRSAGHGRFRHLRMTQLDTHAVDRHAERVRRDLRHHGIGACAEVLRAGAEQRGAVGQ